MLAEFDPWWQLVDNPNDAGGDTLFEEALADSTTTYAILSQRSEQAGISSFLVSAFDRNVMEGVALNLYRSFILRGWWMSNHGE